MKHWVQSSIISRTTDTQRELFFQKSETFGLGQTNWAQIFWGIWGIYFRANYQHYFGTVISLSMVNKFPTIWLILIWKLNFRFFLPWFDQVEWLWKRNKINMICMSHQYVSHKFSMLGLPALSPKQASCLWYV